MYTMRTTGLSTYGQWEQAYFYPISPILHFSSEPRAAILPAPPLVSEWLAAKAPVPVLAAGLDHLPQLPLSDPVQTEKNSSQQHPCQYCFIINICVYCAVVVDQHNSASVLVPVAVAFPVLLVLVYAAPAAVGPR